MAAPADSGVRHLLHLTLPAATALGTSQNRIDVIGLLLGQPLWFLGVYVGMTALAPAMAAWQEQSPRIALAGRCLGARWHPDLARAAGVCRERSSAGAHGSSVLLFVPVIRDPAIHRLTPESGDL